MATFRLNPADYGFTSLDALARAVGTLRGEAGGQGIAGQARIIDNAVDRANSPAFSWASRYNSDPVASQFMAPSQYSTWLPSQASYRTTMDYYNLVNRLGQNPDLYNTLPAGQQRGLQEALTAIYGVMGGDASLRGMNGGATFYSTGNIGSNEAEHVGYGLNTARQYGKVDAHYFYGGGDDTTARTNDAVRAFPIADRLAQLQQTVLPGYSNPLSYIPDGGPPGRPTEFGGSSSLEDMLNTFGDGLRSAGRTVGNAFADLTGRLPTAAELQARLDAVSNGASSIYDQIAGIAGSDEARNFQMATGLDPRRVAIDDAYRLSTGRGASDNDIAHSLQVLQGGQTSLNDLLRGIAGSDEGNSYQINNFYRSAFGRDADSLGLQNALNALRSGQSLRAVETSLLSSPEAETRGITRDQIAGLLTPDYLAPTLNTGTETGTQGGGTTVTTQGGGGTTVGTQGGGTTVGTQGGGTEVVTQGPRTAERQALIDTLSGQFQRATGRGVDAPTIDTWDQELTAGTPMALLEARTLGAPETIQARTGDLDALLRGYQERYGLTPTEVNTLGPMAEEFQHATGRGVDVPTLQAWDRQIDAGTPTSIIEAQLLAAPEVRTRGPDATASLVHDYETRYGLSPDEVLPLSGLAGQFATLTGRPVDAATLQSWDHQIDAGTSMPTLQAGLLQAPEVLARTGGHGDAYDTFASQNGGRSAGDYLAGLANGTGFTGQNTSGGGGGAGGTGGTGSFGLGGITGTGGQDYTFDPAAYLAANPDVQTSGMNPFQHFVLSGFNEGRAIDSAGDHFGPNSNGFLTFDLPSLTQGWDSGLSSTFLNGLGLSTGGSTGGNGGAGIADPFGFSGANVSGFNANQGGGGGGGGGTATTTSGGAPRTRSSSEAFFRAQQASRDYMAQRAVPDTARNYNLNNQQLLNQANTRNTGPTAMQNYLATQNQVNGGLLGAGTNLSIGTSFGGGFFGA